LNYQVVLIVQYDDIINEITFASLKVEQTQNFHKLLFIANNHHQHHLINSIDLNINVTNQYDSNVLSKLERAFLKLILGQFVISRSPTDCVIALIMFAALIALMIADQSSSQIVMVLAKM